MKPPFVILMIMILNTGLISSQSIGIGTNNPKPSAMLDVTSTNKGFLAPRMTTAQRKSISSPAMGLIVFDTDKYTFFFFDGIVWRPLKYELDDDALYSRTMNNCQSQFYDDYGESADISGLYAAVGAPGYDKNSGVQTDDYGSVCFYKRTNDVWGNHTSISPSNLTIGSQFGYAVALSNDFAVIGAPSADVGASNNEGKVYIYKKVNGNWISFQELTGSNAGPGDHFGWDVKIDGKYIIVGAPDDDIVVNNISYSNQGSAYVFFFNGTFWVEQEKLYDGSIGEANSKYGFSVDIDSTGWAVAGAPYSDVGANVDQGEVQVWLRIGTAWASTPPKNSNNTNFPGAANDNFGYSVGIGNENMVVGAPGYTYNSISNSGIIYQYDYSSAIVYEWAVFGGVANENLGKILKFNGQYVVAGLPQYDKNGQVDPGIVKIYTIPIHIQILQTLNENISTQFNQFGTAVGVSGHKIIVTSPVNLPYGKVNIFDIE
jgi:hypothetical protein